MTATTAQHGLTAPHGAPFDSFGISVALSALDTTVLVGAPRHSGTGAAYVFRLRGGICSQAAEFTASHAAALDSSAYRGLVRPGQHRPGRGARRKSDIGAAYVFTGRSRA